MKLSKTTIERLAVHAIRNEVNKPPYLLRADITEGDKGISFDGEINVFIDDSEKAESFYGSVPVQVKGTNVESFSNDKVNLRLKIAHYKNYYKKGGAVIFVVEIKGQENKIFYRQLLPLDLSNIIKNCKSKNLKSNTIELKSIEGTNIDKICRAFLNEQIHQPITLIEEGKALINNQFQTYNMRSLTYNPSKMDIQEVFEHDFFMYGVIGKLQIPISVGRISSITGGSTMDVEINGKSYTFNISTTFSSETFTIIFENTLSMTFKDRKLKIDISKFHSLASQLKIMPLILKLIQRESIKLPFGEFSLNEYSEKSLNFIESMKNHFSFIKELEEAYLYFDIHLDTIFSESPMGMQLGVGLSFLIRASKNEDISDLKRKLPEGTGQGIINLIVGDQVIVCMYYDGILHNLFSEKHINGKAILSYEQPDQCDHSLFVLLNDDSLTKGINIDFHAIRKSFDNFNPYFNEISTNVTTNFCLQCINAYDKSGKDDLLYTADYILSKNYFKEHQDGLSKEYALNLINRLQISKRLHGFLKSEEEDQLLDIKDRFSLKENTDIHFGTSVLLESKNEAERVYSKFDLEMKEMLETMPIMKLYNDMMP
ncbi:DUF4365 domain-containing protein [Paenibacillus sp. YSY-4.3]